DRGPPPLLRSDLTGHISGALHLDREPFPSSDLSHRHGDVLRDVQNLRILRPAHAAREILPSVAHTHQPTPRSHGPHRLSERAPPIAGRQLEIAEKHQVVAFTPRRGVAGIGAQPLHFHTTFPGELLPPFHSKRGKVAGRHLPTLLCKPHRVTALARSHIQGPSRR